MKKQNVLFSAIILSAFLLSALLQSFTFKSSPVDVTGKWNLESYVYNPKNGQMNFRFANNISYTFNADSSGQIISNVDTSAFKWEIKKMRLTLILNSETKNYKIITHSNNELLIVDQEAGVDEYGKYEANEKGLMLKK